MSGFIQMLKKRKEFITINQKWKPVEELELVKSLTKGLTTPSISGAFWIERTSLTPSIQPQKSMAHTL
ncbi:hypothetical protein JZ751_019394, partial [Albula glossodonta]